MQRVLIDYFVCSWKTESFSEGMSLFRLFGCPSYDAQSDYYGTSGFVNINSYYGADECWYYNGIKIHVSCDLCILDCSGKGCRTLEEEFGWKWETFFDAMEHDLTYTPDPKTLPKAHISRLDVTCDVLDDPKFTIQKIDNNIKGKRYVCKSNRYLAAMGTHEEWLMFGSPKSDRRLRIYNKALEQGTTDPWIRAEFQLRNDNAISFLLNYYKIRCIPDCYYGVMHDYLRILKKVLTDATMTVLSSLFFGKSF